MIGIVAINKPKGPTSHDIVDQVRRLTGERRVGHAGTLDPLASGVLVVAIGREFTKQIDSLMKKEKEYVALVKLGETSTTDDEEGEKRFFVNVGTDRDLSPHPDESSVKNVLLKFVGNIMQIPPIYSAIKLNGRKAYELARAGKAVEMKPRPVLIKKIELLKYDWPFLEIRVMCGPGVYIRSLARDIGEKLGVGGYLIELIRTRVGNFILEKALTLEQFKEKQGDN